MNRFRNLICLSLSLTVFAMFLGGCSTPKKDPAEREKEEKIQKAQQYAQNAKPGSLTAKANLVSRYNSGQKTELPTEENAPDQTEDTVLGKRKNKKKK